MVSVAVFLVGEDFRSLHCAEGSVGRIFFRDMTVRRTGER